MSEIGASYYRGQDAHISIGDIVAIVISITFGLPLVVCLVYLLFVWIRACLHKEEMRRDGTLGSGFFWCWKSSSQVRLHVKDLIDSVPAVLPAGKGGDGARAARQSTGLGAEAGREAADRSGSSTPTTPDGDVELTARHSAITVVDGPLPTAYRLQQQQQQQQSPVKEAVIRVA